MKVCKDHHAELASRLVQIFLETDNIIDKLIRCNKEIIDRESKLVIKTSLVTDCQVNTINSPKIWPLIIQCLLHYGKIILGSYNTLVEHF